MPRRSTLLLPEAAVQKAVMALAPLYGVVLDRRNTGAARNARGRLVRYGRRGDSDLHGWLGPPWGEMTGRVIHVEVKRERWKPPGPRAKARPHWERQLDRLREVNAAGGFGFWVDHPARFEKVVKTLRTGLYRVEFDAGEETELVPLEDMR